MDHSQTFIIAEAGVNHNGSLDLALKMINVAVEAGADAIKFQTFKADKIISKKAPKSEYQIETTGSFESQLDMVKKLELKENDHHLLSQHCQEKGITFLSTPFDLESIDLLNSIGLEIFKIPSGEITNLPYLRKLGALNKKYMLSTGMADLGEIEDAVDTLTISGSSLKNIVILHCNTEYPTPYSDVNLKAMLTIKHAFPHNSVGYSDHTLGIEVPVAAVALGAMVIEKHFTLDNTLPGPDHRASLTPNNLSKMIKAIRNIENAMGSGIKKPSKSEMKNKVIVRKSIVASSKISKGETFNKKNITTKRPGTGISPMYWDEIIGRQAIRDFRKDELIET